MTMNWLNHFRRRGIWQCIFLRSIVNGAPYNVDRLESSSWDWPKDTYLQRRLEYLRSRSDAKLELDRPKVKIYSLAAKKNKEVGISASKISFAGRRNGPKRVRVAKRTTARI